jgi:predicted O-linked N-acetylglucosamine transferase (SPINDLY family)
MPELVTQTMEDYEARAVNLARDPRKLAALRDKLGANRHAAPLFDTPRFARDLEQIYLRIAQRLNG